ncbi:GntR family transcriptional regulator [Pedobacter panaciterrae]|jgi:Predicted transcriptional regulators|uniref:GntR family transcriptional regulator n=1 Tax=Pedobacter panaciterrae TaxID=363849 RepID=A0ABU8NLS7_9SPHI|nr:GntR family transcriptional regulator [Pedobacter panaciterrae]NQX52805.1 GntR family transcriptional regulator [Pedobacter panaciterrae]
MEFRENEAIYMQIAGYVTENIMLEKWLPEEKLPSVRELASDLQVNPLTVVRAYEFLQGKEVIANKRGIGFFIAADAVQKVKNYSKERFLGQELPELFKSMYLLGISVEDIAERFEIFKAQNYQTK